MKAAWCFHFALLLAACRPSGEQEMEICRSDSLRMYPAGSSPYSYNLNSYVKACMAAKGYAFSTLPYDCGHGDPYEDPACYVR